MHGNEDDAKPTAKPTIDDPKLRVGESTGVARENPMTYEDYARMPDDGRRYELVDGKLEQMSPSPNRSHQLVAFQLCSLLNATCYQDYVIVMAPVDVLISPQEVRQPDAVMIHRSRMSIYKARGNIVEPPDLVIEVLSPDSLRRDKLMKRNSYAKFGVPEYWIVDPDLGTLEQFSLSASRDYALVETYAGDEQITSEHLSCVSFSMDDFMRLPRQFPSE